MNQPTAFIRTIGRYQVLEELGRGGMAVVYKAFDPVIGRTVALKTVAFGSADPEERDLRGRLYREACAAGTLTHPNIVTIYDVIEENGTTAVAMEFVEGQTLAGLIAERAPLPLDEALEIFEQMCAAIDYAGARDIVHRDIKPANIILTLEGRVKIADFGVARMAASHVTQTGLIVGSPSYMSPEQVRGQQLDSRSDLFSATVILYELLTRERPFAGDDIATTMFRIVHEPPFPPSRFNLALDDGISAVIERGLSKEPDARPRSGADLCRDLRAALVPSLPPIVVDRPRPRRRRLALAAAAVGGLVLLLLMLRAGGGGQGAGEAVAPPLNAQAEAAPSLPAADVAPPPARAPEPVSAPAPVPPPAPAPAPRAERPPAPEPEPEPEPAPPPAVGALSVAYEGDPYPVTLLIDGRRAGQLSRSGARLEVPAGTRRVRAVNDEIYLAHDFGSIELARGASRSLSLPAMASAFVGVQGDLYAGLRIAIDGRVVAGPYPAQLARIAVGRHEVSFRWTTGPLVGKEVTGPIELAGTGHFVIRVVPDVDRITVQKVR